LRNAQELPHNSNNNNNNNNNNISVGVYLNAFSTARAPTRNPTQEHKFNTITIQIHEKEKGTCQTKTIHVTLRK